MNSNIVCDLAAQAWSEKEGFNAMKPREEGRLFKYVYLDENVSISFEIPLKFAALTGSIGNKSALAQVMAWRRTGDKPLPDQ